ncbi:DUF7848 domain-containing protein [Streptomyces buecherae]
MISRLWPRHWESLGPTYAAMCLGASCEAEQDDRSRAADVDVWMARHADVTGHNRYRVSVYATHDVRDAKRATARAGLAAAGRLAAVVVVYKVDEAWSRAVVRALDRLQAPPR